MTATNASIEGNFVECTPGFSGAGGDVARYPPYEIPAYLCEDAPASEDDQDLKEEDANETEDQSSARAAFKSVKFSVPAFGTRAYLRSFWLQKKQHRADLKPFQEPTTEDEDEDEEADFEKVSFAENTTVIIYDEFYYTEKHEAPAAPSTGLKRAISSATNPNYYEEKFLSSNQAYCDKATKEGLCEEDEMRPADHNESMYRLMLLQSEDEDESDDEEETMKYIQRMQSIHRYNLEVQLEENTQAMEKLGLPDSGSFWADME